MLVVLGLLLPACAGAAAPDTDCENPESVTERVRFASIVVLATVAEWDGTTAQLEVEEIWRGPDMPVEVAIVPEPGRAYTAGVRYLVFPTGSPPPLTDARCSATTRWDESLEELRPARTRAPRQLGPVDADLPWEWFVAAAALVGIVAAGRHVFEKRRHPEPVWNPDYRLDDGNPPGSS